MSRIDRNLLVVEPYRRIRPTGELPFPVDYGMGSIVTEVEGGSLGVPARAVSVRTQDKLTALLS